MGRSRRTPQALVRRLPRRAHRVPLGRRAFDGTRWRGGYGPCLGRVRLYVPPRPLRRPHLAGLPRGEGAAVVNAFDLGKAATPTAESSVSDYIQPISVFLDEKDDLGPVIFPELLPCGV